jgi:hypothetical protein
MKTNNFKKLLEELGQWIDGSSHDGSLEYAFHNGYYKHAVCLWESSGASKYDFSANISRNEEMKEIRDLIKSADVFICPDCNHHAFYPKGELSEAPQCLSCLGDNMILDKKQRF